MATEGMHSDAQENIQATHAHTTFHKRRIINTEIHGKCLSSGKIGNKLSYAVLKTHSERKREGEKERKKNMLL